MTFTSPSVKISFWIPKEIREISSIHENLSKKSFIGLTIFPTESCMIAPTPSSTVVFSKTLKIVFILRVVARYTVTSFIVSRLEV